MEVSLMDLEAQYREIEDEVLAVVKKVLRSGCYILGPNVRLLEEEIASYCGSKYAVGVASGTDALELSLAALGVGEGDEVITTPFTFVATAEAIVRVGARPVFVDIEKDSFNIDPVRIKEGITERTRAIIPVHLYGQSANMEAILEIAEEYHLKVIEDAAQAFGAEYRFSLSGESNGRQRVKKAGSSGDAGCLSFFPTKNLAGYGDGGMVLAWDGEIAEKLRRLRVHGTGQDSYSYILRGKNSRLDEMQAAILRVKLKYVEEWLKMRQQKASLYNKLLGEASISVRTPLVTPYTTHTYCVYTILAPRRNELREYLQKKGINCRVYYPVPLHLQDTYKYLGYHQGDFPVAEKVSEEVISLPVYPELPEEKLRYVVQEIRKFYS